MSESGEFFSDVGYCYDAELDQGNSSKAGFIIAGLMMLILLIPEMNLGLAAVLAWRLTPLGHFYAIRWLHLGWVGHVPWWLEFAIVCLLVGLVEFLLFEAWRAHTRIDYPRSSIDAWDRIVGPYPELWKLVRGKGNHLTIQPGWVYLLCWCWALTGFVALTAWVWNAPVSLIAVGLYFVLPIILKFIVERIDFD